MKYKVAFENLAGIKTTITFTAESTGGAAKRIKEYQSLFPMETKNIREIEEIDEQKLVINLAQ